MSEFITPPKHVNFLAKRLFADVGEIIDGSIAYLQPSGGGPIEPHTHEHNHLFIVTQGEARIVLADQTVIVRKDESLLVQGNIPHCVWNNTDGLTVILGISIKNG